MSTHLPDQVVLGQSRGVTFCHQRLSSKRRHHNALPRVGNIHGICAASDSSLAIGHSAYPFHISVFDLHTQSVSRLCSGHWSTVNKMTEILPDCQLASQFLFASSSQDRTVRVWNAENGKPILKYQGKDFVRGVLGYSRRSRRLYFGIPRVGIVGWDIQKNASRRIFELSRQTCFPSGVAVDGEREIIFASLANRDLAGNNIHVYSPETSHELVASFSVGVGRFAHVETIFYHSRSKSIIVVFRGQVRVFDVRNPTSAISAIRSFDLPRTSMYSPVEEIVQVNRRSFLLANGSCSPSVITLNGRVRSQGSFESSVFCAYSAYRRSKLQDQLASLDDGVIPAAERVEFAMSLRFDPVTIRFGQSAFEVPRVCVLRVAKCYQ